MVDDARLKKLKFRAWHRGFVEADLILGNFADAHGADLSAEQLDRLESLMAEADPDIYAWILGQADVPEQFDNDVLAMIRAFKVPGVPGALLRGA
jgi:antitoxin CptB